MRPKLRAMHSSAFLGKRAGLSLLSISLLPALGCTRVEAARAPDGAYVLSCERGMSACVNQAAKICGDDGYTILGGVSSNHLLGGSSSSYRAVAESAELSVRCGIEVPEKNREGIYELPERTDDPVPPTSEPASKVPPAPRVCTPGATQKCVGSGACDGGQICVADGSGFGSCDCGGNQAESAPSSSESGSQSEEVGTGSKSEIKGEQKAPELPGAKTPPVPLK